MPKKTIKVGKSRGVRRPMAKEALRNARSFRRGTLGAVVGDYNDGGVLVRKDLEATLFAPFDHPFAIRGATRARYVVADERPPTKIRQGKTRWNDLPLAEPFSADDLSARLRAGLPTLKA